MQKFWVRKNLGSKNFEFWKFWVQKAFSQKNLGQNIFWTKNLYDQKIFSTKRFWVKKKILAKKYFGSDKCWVSKKHWFKNNFWSKKYWVNKNFGQFWPASGNQWRSAVGPHIAKSYFETYKIYVHMQKIRSTSLKYWDLKRRRGDRHLKALC